MNDLYLQNMTALNMDILEVDDILLGKWWEANHICSPYTRIYMPTNGKGYLRFGTEKVVMTPGNIYIIPAGTTFSYSCESGFSKIYFHISIKRTGGYDIFEDFQKYISFSDPETILRIKECFPVDSVYKVMELKACLYTLVCKCIIKDKDRGIGIYSKRISEIIAYVSDNLSSNLTVEKLADAFFMSPAKIRKIFRDEMGISIGKYIDDAIMLAAEKEIRLGTRSIKETSDALGFCDQFYFSRCFSKKFGMPPQQYRKVHRTRGFTL